MNKIFPIAVTVITIFLLGMAVVQYQPDKDAVSLKSVNSDVSRSRQQMKMVLANTPEMWAKGLQGLSEPDDEHGMLFDFGVPGKRCMWNKDIPYAVDVGFYDDKWKLLGGATMEAHAANPICSSFPARYVVEVRGGWFKDHSKKG